MIFNLPNRFESFSRIYKEDINRLLIKPQKDLEVFQRIAFDIKQAHQGKIVFIQGKPGIGKSTLSHSLPYFLDNNFYKEIRVPAETFILKLQDIPKYIFNGLQNREDRYKILIFTIDNRESPFIEDNLNNVFSDLKSIIRGNSHLLILWPVVNEKFATKAIDVIESLGGKSSLYHEPMVKINGLEKEKYFQVLERIFHLKNVFLTDFGIAKDEIEAVQYSNITIGEFLNEVSNLITRKIDIAPPMFDFNKLVFSISSSSKDLLNVARELRRGNSFLLDASRLLMNTSESNIAQWWQNRNHEPQTSLAYIISLFEAELTILTPTAVVHACRHFGDDELKNYTKEITSNISRARKALSTTELYKSILSLGDNSSRRGANNTGKSESIYKKIQQISDKKHKIINLAIISLLSDIDKTPIINVACEVFDKGIIADAVVECHQQKVNIEFHHKSFDHYNQNKVAIYILEKLKEYAIAYGITPR